MQGHRRRRRRIPEGKVAEALHFTFFEWKVMKQYRAQGDLLDRAKMYGYGAAIESFIEEDFTLAGENGHQWLEADYPEE